MSALRLELRGRRLARIHVLDRGNACIGSAANCDVVIPGIQPHHLEVEHTRQTIRVRAASADAVTAVGRQSLTTKWRIVELGTQLLIHDARGQQIVVTCRLTVRPSATMLSIPESESYAEEQLNMQIVGPSAITAEGVFASLPKATPPRSATPRRPRFLTQTTAVALILVFTVLTIAALEPIRLTPRSGRR
jgi:hypothetical protein